MNSIDQTPEWPERLGNVLAIVFLVALAALFLYGYLPRFLATL